MQDIAPFFDIVIVIAAVVTPAIVLVRLVRGGEQGSLANLFAAPDYNAWPRGVQEEEPRPWAFATPATSGASAPSGAHAVRRPSRVTADGALSPAA